jgi:hypothetical protein
MKTWQNQSELKLDPAEMGIESFAEALARKEYTTELLTNRILSIGESISAATRERRLFITPNSFIGLGPDRMQRYDYAVVAKGCKTPLVLRTMCKFCGISDLAHMRWCGSSSPRQPEFETRLIGDCSIYGLMDGELLEDPKRFLPEDGLPLRYLKESIVYDLWSKVVLV